MLPEVINEERGLSFMSAESRHILNDNRLDSIVLDLFIYFINTLAVEVHTADIVVKGLADNFMPVLFGVLNKDASLVR